MCLLFFVLEWLDLFRNLYGLQNSPLNPWNKHRSGVYPPVVEEHGLPKSGPCQSAPTSHISCAAWPCFDARTRRCPRSAREARGSKDWDLPDFHPGEIGKTRQNSTLEHLGCLNIFERNSSRLSVCSKTIELRTGEPFGGQDSPSSGGWFGRELMSKEGQSSIISSSEIITVMYTYSMSTSLCSVIGTAQHDKHHWNIDLQSFEVLLSCFVFLKLVNAKIPLGLLRVHWPPIFDWGKSV